MPNLRDFSVGDRITLRNYAEFADYSSHVGEEATIIGIEVGRDSRPIQIGWSDGETSRVDMDNVHLVQRTKAFKVKYEQVDLLELAKGKRKPLMESVKDAIKMISESYYIREYQDGKNVFFKAELEAHLHRGRDDDYDEYCDDCDGEGYFSCDECEDGRIYVDGSEDYETCQHCDGEGQIECNSCEGSGRYGDGQEWSDYRCHDFLHENVSEEAREAVVFSRFYYDGSVDSEFCLTLPLTIQGLGYFMEYVNAFKALADEIGNGLDVTGAGMHLTILRSPSGRYPSDNGVVRDTQAFKNFQTNMTKLIPALYLLASEDHKSRGLGYRRPQIGRGDHGSAVDVASHGRCGALEWRVFETCYDRPEMIYDFICVIAKGLQFYAPKVKPVKLSRIGELSYVSNNGEMAVHKYFMSEKHLKALEEGVKYLLPDHRTFREVKKLRNFTVTPSSLKKLDARLTRQAEASYEDYKRRHMADRKVQEATIYREMLERVKEEIDWGMRPNMSAKQMEKRAKQYLAEWKRQNKLNKRKYIKDKILEAKFGARSRNQYRLRV